MSQAAEILQAYLKVTQHMSQQFRTYFGQFNLTFPQAMVLTALGEGGAMPISALAEKTGSANSTISGIVDRLEKLDLAHRTRSEADRRVIYVEVTPRYTQLRSETLGSVNDFFSTLVREITPEGRAEILRALDTLDRALTPESEPE
jgi:DNA-binding MarR family transcriptional regulator